MRDLKSLNQADLCSVLGYEKGHATRDSQNLLDSIEAYLQDYEADGTRIPPNEIADPQDAQLCAYNFLLENDRAELLWPPNSGLIPVWPQNRPLILSAVTFLFRRRAFYNYQKRLKREKIGATKEAVRKIAKNLKAKRRRSMSSEKGRDLEGNTLGVASPAGLAPQRFGRKRCVKYLKSIHPQGHDEERDELTINWLAEAGSTWPSSADVRLQLFMHNRNFYFSEYMNDEIILELINLLKEGTEFESDVSRTQLLEFRHRVVDRIEYYSQQFTRDRFLEYQVDGTLRKTRKFKDFWNNREEYWRGHPHELAESPMLSHGRPQKRLKTLHSAGHHLSESQIIYPKLILESVKRSESELASMAMSALGFAAEQEDKPRTNSMTELMDSISEHDETTDSTSVEKFSTLVAPSPDIIMPDINCLYTHQSMVLTPSQSEQSSASILTGISLPVPKATDQKQDSEIPATLLSTANTAYKSPFITSDSKDLEDRVAKKQSSSQPIGDTGVIVMPPYPTLVSSVVTTVPGDTSILPPASKIAKQSQDLEITATLLSTPDMSYTSPYISSEAGALQDRVDKVSSSQPIGDARFSLMKPYHTGTSLVTTVSGDESVTITIKEHPHLIPKPPRSNLPILHSSKVNIASLQRTPVCQEPRVSGRTPIQQSLVHHVVPGVLQSASTQPKSQSLQTSSTSSLFPFDALASYERDLEEFHKLGGLAEHSILARPIEPQSILCPVKPSSSIYSGTINPSTSIPKLDMQMPQINKVALADPQMLTVSSTSPASQDFLQAQNPSRPFSSALGTFVTQNPGSVPNNGSRVLQPKSQVQIDNQNTHRPNQKSISPKSQVQINTKKLDRLAQDSVTLNYPVSTFSPINPRKDPPTFTTIPQQDISARPTEISGPGKQHNDRRHRQSLKFVLFQGQPTQNSCTSPRHPNLPSPQVPEYHPFSHRTPQYGSSPHGPHFQHQAYSNPSPQYPMPVYPPQNRSLHSTAAPKPNLRNLVPLSSSIRESNPQTPLASRPPHSQSQPPCNSPPNRRPQNSLAQNQVLRNPSPPNPYQDKNAAPRFERSSFKQIKNHITPLQSDSTVASRRQYLTINDGAKHIKLEEVPYSSTTETNPLSSPPTHSEVLPSSICRQQPSKFHTAPNNLHLVDTCNQNECLSTPPDLASPAQGETFAVREERPPEALAQIASPVKDLTTPSRTPSPAQVQIPDRGPQAVIPEPMQWSSSLLEKASASQSQLHPTPPAEPVKPSTDTSAATYQVAPTQNLELVLQKADKSFDFEHPLSSKVLKDSSVSGFFEIYALNSGVSLSSLNVLTFSACFGDRQDLIVKRSGGERAWEKLKKRLGNLLFMEQKDNPDETEFEVWVKPGESSNGIVSGRGLL